MRMFYECDVDRNTECSKTHCHINGGECRNTTKSTFAKLDGKILAVLSDGEAAALIHEDEEVRNGMIEKIGPATVIPPEVLQGETMAYSVPQGVLDGRKCRICGTNIPLDLDRNVCRKCYRDNKYYRRKR